MRTKTLEIEEIEFLIDVCTNEHVATYVSQFASRDNWFVFFDLHHRKITFQIQANGVLIVAVDEIPLISVGNYYERVANGYVKWDEVSS